MKKILLFLISCILLFGCSEDSTIPEEQDVFLGKLGTFIDERDGKEYKILTVGKDTWFAENLAYLPKVNMLNEGSFNEPHYYVYGYDGKNISEAKALSSYSEYGVLYNWEAAQISCPGGWHIATSAEWSNLIKSCENEGLDYEDYEQAIYLKSKDGWSNGFNGIDLCGFNALPNGRLYYYRPHCYNCVSNGGSFGGVGETGYWWTPNEDHNNEEFDQAESIVLGSTHHRIGYLSEDKTFGYSVRCVKD